MIKKIISSILILIILSLAIPIEPISIAVISEFEKVQTIASTEAKVGV